MVITGLLFAINTLAFAPVNRADVGLATAVLPDNVAPLTYVKGIDALAEYAALTLDCVVYQPLTAVGKTVTEEPFSANLSVGVTPGNAELAELPVTVKVTICDLRPSRKAVPDTGPAAGTFLPAIG
jgi:hypothetical protein